MSEKKKPSPSLVFSLGLYHLVLGAALIYCLCLLWPVGKGCSLSEACIPADSPNPDLCIILIVLVCGAIGGLLHGMRSFAAYVGNRELSSDWFWSYLIKEPQGAILALVFYFLSRVGMTAVATDANDVNLCGIAALSVLAGMFADISVRKLRDVFGELIKASPENLKDPLDEEDEDDNSIGEADTDQPGEGQTEPDPKPTPEPGKETK